MKIVSKKIQKADKNFYDIQMEYNHNFVLGNGVVLHNCGTGVGFSVESIYTNKLPEIPDDLYKSDTTVVVPDSKEGWAKSLRQLISLLYAGEIPKIDLHKVRPAGTRLKVFGGRASGPKPLTELFNFVIHIFKNATGRKLYPIECHDICCKIAEVVVVGGVRRAALISLSDLSDNRMAHAKSGAWWETSGQRSLANNSAVYKEKPSMSEFMTEWQALYESKSGERGIFNRQAITNQVAKNGRREVTYIWGTNPCSEIILRPYEVCNLTEVIIRPDDTLESLKQKIRIATILGTFQSTLTHFPYLRKIWQKNAEEERLLGVSLTGIYDNKLTYTNNEELENLITTLKEHAIEVNKEWADKIGINQSTAITAIKPSGCLSLDTKIKTSNGIMSMQELFEEHDINPAEYNSGEWIYPKHKTIVYDENNTEQEITKFFINGFSPVYEIEDENGNIYKLTPEHKVKTKNGWVKAKDLTIDDEIITFS